MVHSVLGQNPAWYIWYWVRIYCQQKQQQLQQSAHAFSRKNILFVTDNFDYFKVFFQFLFSIIRNITDLKTMTVAAKT